VSGGAKILRRGTQAWDLRELARQGNGCKCICLGEIRLRDVEIVASAQNVKERRRIGRLAAVESYAEATQ
jgi:hypothetical protein